MRSNHIHIFQVHEDYKEPISKTKALMYDEFYKPSANEIFKRWIINLPKLVEKSLSKKIYYYLNSSDEILDDAVHTIILLINQKSELISFNEHSFLFFKEDSQLYQEILFAIKTMMLEDTANW